MHAVQACGALDRMVSLTIGLDFAGKGFYALSRCFPGVIRNSIMRKTMSLHKTVSRVVNEIIIAIGLLSVSVGALQKLLHLGSVYDPRLLGLTPKDFLAFGGILFLLAIAIASRRILKHLEIIAKRDRGCSSSESSRP